MRQLLLAAALTLSVTSGAFAQTAPHAPGMKDMPMKGMSMDEATAHGMLHGEGKVVALDPSKGSITISHDPIAALKWPAMTMAFNAAPDLQAGLKPGQRVTFCFAKDGGGHRITMLTGH